MRATSKRCRQGRACGYGWRHTLGNRRMLEDPRTQESCRRRKALWKKKAPQAIFCALWHERRNKHRLRGSLSSNYATHFHHLLINLVLIWDFRRAVVANLAFFGLRRLYFTKPDGRRGQFGGNRSRTGPPPPFETRSEPAPAPARCGLPHAIGAGMSPRPPASSRAAKQPCAASAVAGPANAARPPEGGLAGEGCRIAGRLYAGRRNRPSRSSS